MIDVSSEILKREKSEAARYKKYYKIDLNNKSIYDLVIDSSDKTPEVILAIILNGSMSPQSYVAMKKMDFKRWTIIFNGGGAIGVTTTIVLGIFMQNVWALIIGFTVEALFRLILSFVFCPFRPGRQLLS